MAFFYTDNQLSQSFYVKLELQNDGGQSYINSSDTEYHDHWNITIDQLEGEINVPYQYVDQNVDGDVKRKIIVPNSILGGFGQWRINYTFIQYPETNVNQGTFIAGSFNTERISVPKRTYQPVYTTFTFDKNTIR